MDELPPILIDLLLNPIIRSYIAPYLSLQDLLRLNGSSKSIRQLVYGSPELWKHVDLSRAVRGVVDFSPVDRGGFSWRAERMDESLTEDEFYAGPLRGALSFLHRKHVLRNIYVMILDGLSVPVELIHEIITEDRYRVRILSIRGAKHLNTSRLIGLLHYLIRPTRPPDTPKLKGLYIFLPPTPASKTLPSSTTTLHSHSTTTPSLGILSTQGAQLGTLWHTPSSPPRPASSLTSTSTESLYYNPTGRLFPRPSTAFSDLLVAAQQALAFDAVLCRGPRHDIARVASSVDFLQPAIANVALGAGCVVCGSAPEGGACWRDDGECGNGKLPLLAPVNGTRVRDATRQEGRDGRKLWVRCEECLRGRWCEMCMRWWCEDCYTLPRSRFGEGEAGREEVARRLFGGESKEGMALCSLSVQEIDPDLELLAELIECAVRLNLDELGFVAQCVPPKQKKLPQWHVGSDSSRGLVIESVMLASSSRWNCTLRALRGLGGCLSIVNRMRLTSTLTEPQSTSAV